MKQLLVFSLFFVFSTFINQASAQTSLCNPENCPKICQILCGSSKTAATKVDQEAKATTVAFETKAAEGQKSTCAKICRPKCCATGKSVKASDNETVNAILAAMMPATEEEETSKKGTCSPKPSCAKKASCGSKAKAVAATY